MIPCRLRRWTNDDRNRKRLLLVAFMSALMFSSAFAESAMALRAPVMDGSTYTYYYVSDDVPDNGGFPDTWVGFYWNSPGSKTITYNPRKCNNGGYEDSTDGDPNVVIYKVNSNGTPSTSKLYNATHIDACHENSNNTNFPITLDSSSYDSEIGMYGAIVYVYSEGDGASRAWFNLETADTDGADFGVIGGKPAGYSRDFSSSSKGDYYNLQAGFGSCDSSSKANQKIAFFDTDKTKYQNSSWDTNALRIQFVNTSTGSNIPNTSGAFGSLVKMEKRPDTTTWFNTLANSAEIASLTFDMAANTGYRLNVAKVREGNDITIQVPTNEIYSKKVCRLDWKMAPSTSISTTTATVGDTVTWTHKVTNNGPDPTDRAVSYGHDHTNGWTGSTSVGTIAAGASSGAVTTYTESHRITADDIGKTLCSRAYASPAGSTDSGTTYATSACITPTSNWKSTAATSINQTLAKPGDTVTWTHTVSNDGPDRTSKEVKYGYTRSNGWTGSTEKGSKVAEQAKGQLGSYTDTRIITIDDVGKTFCSQAYIVPTSHTNAATVYATSQCVTVPNWTITAYTYSAVNPSNPLDNGVYNNTRKIAYPNHPTFGGHAAKTEDDKIYYMVRVWRGDDVSPDVGAFKYWPNWTFGSGLIGANSVNSGQLDVSALCPTGWSYDTSFKRCAKAGSPAVDTTLARNATGYYTTTADGRFWNNSLPSGKTLSDLKGQDICYIMSFNRRALSSPDGNDTVSEYWGDYEAGLENRCSVTVKSPWILEPRVTNTNTTGRAVIGDTYTITPSAASSETNVGGTSHVMSIVRVVGSTGWTPTQGLNAMGSPAPSAVNYGTGAESSTATTLTPACPTIGDANFSTKNWTGTGCQVTETFQEAWYGKKVCYYAVITTGGWAYDKTSEVRYSNPTCVKWTKSPQIQMRGADSSAGGIWDGTTTSYNGGFIGVSQGDARRGSWSQYGILAYKGATNYFGSAGYTANDTANRSKACSLTFANTISGAPCTSGAIGGNLYQGSSLTKTISLPTNAKKLVSSMNDVPNVTRFSAASCRIGTSCAGLWSQGSGTYKWDGDLEIFNSTNDTAAKQLTVVVSGDVYITQDIYNDLIGKQWSNLTEVPVITIIAKNIFVRNDVNYIYGTYIATDQFYSCATSVATINGTELMDNGNCSRQLKVDGAVISRLTPALRRTIGSGYNSSSATIRTVTANGETHLEAITPAELFNYQPNLFLTPYALQSTEAKSQSWVVTKQTILPARF